MCVHPRIQLQRQIQIFVEVEVEKEMAIEMEIEMERERDREIETGIDRGIEIEIQLEVDRDRDGDIDIDSETNMESWGPAKRKERVLSLVWPASSRHSLLVSKSWISMRFWALRESPKWAWKVLGGSGVVTKMMQVARLMRESRYLMVLLHVLVVITCSCGCNFSCGYNNSCGHIYICILYIYMYMCVYAFTHGVVGRVTTVVTAAVPLHTSGPGPTSGGCQALHVEGSRDKGSVKLNS